MTILLGKRCTAARRATPRRARGFQRVPFKSNYQCKLESIARHPEKHGCRRRFEYAVKTGKLTPQPCFVCGCSAAQTEGHHWDYTKPFDVFWLCRQHHIDVHKGKII